MSRQARALINLDAIRANYRLARAQSPDSKAVAIVKANAYGHGAVPVAKALEAEVDAFGVACIEEALELREGGVKAPVLLLEGFFKPDELQQCIELNFWTALHSEFQIDQIAELPEDAGLSVWLKMDSGCPVGRTSTVSHPFTQANVSFPQRGPVGQLGVVGGGVCAKSTI